MPLEHTEPWESPRAAAIMKMRLEAQVLCESKRASMRKNTNEGTKDPPTDPFYIFSRPFNIRLETSLGGVLLDKTKCVPCLGLISWRFIERHLAQGLFGGNDSLVGVFGSAASIRSDFQPHILIISVTEEVAGQPRVIYWLAGCEKRVVPVPTS
jgi:hypothetical protein